MHRRRFLTLVLAGFCLLLALTGCATTARRQNIATAAPKLAAELRALGPNVDPEEAEQVALALLLETQHLASQYGQVNSSNVQNMLVNLGVKQRGLCWHYAVDLLAYTRTLDQHSFDFTWAVAHEGFQLKEHSVVVATAKGQPFSSGLVLDAWRESYHLTWLPVAKDVNYPWKPRQ